MDTEPFPPVAKTVVESNGAAGTAVSSTLAASIPALVAEVYAAAPSAERGRLIEHLSRPLGMLSLFGIAGGVFGVLRLGGGRRAGELTPEFLDSVDAEQIGTLVDHTDQVDSESVDALAQIVAASPSMARSANAARLLLALSTRARSRHRVTPATG